jgi:outer membrane immunogenic protein
MKKTFLTAAALALAISVGSASAADLPSRKAPPYFPPPPPPPPMWTGFYVGLNAGGTWSESNSVRTDAANIRCVSFGGPCGPLSTARLLAAASAVGATGAWPVSNGGFIGGGQVGYNYQFSTNFVAGLEADIQGIAGANNSAAAANVVPVPLLAPPTVIMTSLSANKSVDYIGTVRGRLGYLVTPTLLVYGTGGLAYGGVTSSTSIFQAAIPSVFGMSTPWGGAGSYSDTRVGWTAGGGLEWMFSPNWSAKVEYLYYDLGSVTYSVSPMGLRFFPDGEVSFLNAVQSTTRFNGHIARVGVNYHFNWDPVPVVAKY